MRRTVAATRAAPAAGPALRATNLGTGHRHVQTGGPEDGQSRHAQTNQRKGFQPVPQDPSATPASGGPVISLRDARLALSSAEGMVEILRGITLNIEAGETVGVLGPSGAGKTSLLMIMAGLESLSGGGIDLAGQDITGMGEDALAALRRDHVGIIFQAFRLIPSMTALQNVAVPLELAGRADATELAAAALESVGLGHRSTHLPDQMSGGEQQRVAIARAIAPRPRILLADEPTGNLDSGTSERVITTLFDATQAAGAALVLVTHDAMLAEQCGRVLTIEDGQIVQDRASSSRAA